VAVPEREVRAPIDVITAGRALLELAAGLQQGIFHLPGRSRVNRLELNQAIAARFGLPQHLLIPAPPEAISGRAPRPRDVSLMNTRSDELKTPLLTLDQGLSLILQTATMPQRLTSAG
jgi:dTDP-4-dehydrorhamnose reductase